MRKRPRLHPNGAWRHDSEIGKVLETAIITLFVAALFTPAFIGCHCDHTGQRTPCDYEPTTLSIDPQNGMLVIGPVSPSGGPVVPLNGGCK